jgi:acetylornithine deacetylase
MASEVTELLAALVAQRSVSDRPSTAIADWAIAASGAADGEVTVQRYAGGDKVNVLLLRGPRTGGGLTLCGHLDLVPADEEGWTSDPWSLTDAGDRWVGRGACDMKGFLALALDRFRRTDPATLQAPLAVLLTSDEEVGSRGAQAWVDGNAAALAPRQVLVGEPTGLRAVRLHKGHLRLRLVVRGRAAHSGYPHRGHNAIEAATPALAALVALRAELAAEDSEHAARFPETPFVALNVGRVDGGVATNVIPDRCVVELGVRPLPGGTGEALAARVERAVAPALEGQDWELAVDNDSPALLTPASAPLFEALREELGQTDDPGVSYASDAGTLTRAGHQCVLFGAGSIEAAHRADEFVPKDELERAGAVVDAIVGRFCGGGPP